LYYYNEFAKTKKIGKYDNTFAAGRLMRDIRTVFLFALIPHAIHFAPTGDMYFNIPNETNYFILILYCHQLISIEGKTK